MLNQQRTLLYLIQQFGGKISRLQLTKLCFLLSQELPQETRLKFYQFIPYRRGPFSFCMYQESESLVGNYYLEKIDDRYLQITEYGKLMGLSLSQVFKNQIDNIIQRHGKKTVQELLDYVYDQFPWYTINSIASPQCSRPVAETAIYTVGYEGLVVDSFLDLLLKNGIQCLIDVRQNPISRRYGFYKKTLASFL